jgi:hypothetical protein
MAPLLTLHAAPCLGMIFLSSKRVHSIRESTFLLSRDILLLARLEFRICHYYIPHHRSINDQVSHKLHQTNLPTIFLLLEIPQRPRSRKHWLLYFFLNLSSSLPLVDTSSLIPNSDESKLQRL